jgi:pathogenesis-related protein 1
MDRNTSSFGLALAVMALAAAAFAPFATAQASLRGKQPAVGGVPTSAQSATAAGLPQPAVETKDVQGILAAQNEARRRLNLAPLTWSGVLMEKARTTAMDAATNACSKGLSYKAAEKAGAAVYWAAALPHTSGGASIQAITPSFLVSEWQEGKADYDAGSGECRRSGECQSWARMVAPAARQVGCARVICPSQGQVWACHYDTPEKPRGPELRRRSPN